jgi:hypothetical protein
MDTNLQHNMLASRLSVIATSYSIRAGIAGHDDHDSS